LDPAQRRRLEKLLFPELVRRLRAMTKPLAKHCVDMAVYFNAGEPKFGGKVILVDAPLSLRVKRLKKRGLSPQRALAQAKALSFGPAQRRKSDLVLNNAGSEKQLFSSINRLL
jgi:dephospho-CoA kinase